MESKTVHYLIISLILTAGHLTPVQAVTDAELEALEEQIEQLEAEEIKQAEAEANRKAEEKRKTQAEAKRKAGEEVKRKAEVEKKRLAELERQRQDEQRRITELERNRQEEETKIRAEEEKKEKYKLLISEAEQALLVKDYSKVKDKYTEALNIYPDNPEIIGKHSQLKIMIENCQSIIGTWVWFTGNTRNLNPNGTVVTSDDDIVGTWECSDPENRQFILRWDAGWIDDLRLSHDGNKLKGKNQWSFPVSAQRNQ